MLTLRLFWSNGVFVLMYSGSRRVFLPPTALPLALTCIANAEALSTLTNLDNYNISSCYLVTDLHFFYEIAFYKNKKQASVQRFKLIHKNNSFLLNAKISTNWIHNSILSNMNIRYNFCFKVEWYRSTTFYYSYNLRIFLHTVRFAYRKMNDAHKFHASIKLRKKEIFEGGWGILEF